MTNAEISRLLWQMARALEAARVQFKPAAYERASIAIEELPESVAAMHAAGGAAALRKIPGVGAGIARAIEEILSTGRLAALDALHAEHPAELLALAAVPGIGHERAKVLWDRLGIRTIDDLEAAARGERLLSLPRFGEKTLLRILRGLEMRRERGDRQLLARVHPLAERALARLRAVTGCLRADVAGDLRRRTEEVSTLEVVASAAAPGPGLESFAKMPEVDRVLESGEGTLRARLGIGIDARITVVADSSFGAALLLATGSEAHLVGLRARGLDAVLARAGSDERAIYQALDLAFVAPELREGTGEIEAAASGTLPAPIDEGALRGDLQVQTTATDGAASAREMAQEARRLGREYVAITDHTRDLAMVGGADEAALLAQAAEIRALDASMEGIRVLTGAEVNIRKDGTLDIADEALATLDVVGAGAHSFFDLPRDEMTARLVRAMENPNVDILFHPTCRILGRRPAADVDIDRLIDAALRTGTVLEIDAQPDRLDLRDSHVRRAVEAGVPLSIDSDAHRLRELQFPEACGLSLARRGWAETKHVVNARPLEEFLASLKGGRRR